jgi:hypothetical protein
MDRQNGIPGVIGFIKQGLELRIVQPFDEGGQRLFKILIDGLAFAGELKENFDVFFLSIEVAQKLNFALEPLLCLLEGLRFFLVLPDFGRGQLAVEALDFSFFRSEVKESLAALRIWRTVP